MGGEIPYSWYGKHEAGMCARAAGRDQQCVLNWGEAKVWRAAQRGGAALGRITG